MAVTAPELLLRVPILIFAAAVDEVADAGPTPMAGNDMVLDKPLINVHVHCE